MSGDEFDFPVTTTRRGNLPSAPTGGQPTPRFDSLRDGGSSQHVRFTEEQTTKLIDGGVDLGKGALGILQTYMDIQKIREEGDVAVGKIEATTRQLTEKIKEEANKIRVESDRTVKRGEVASVLIGQCLAQLPAIEEGSRQAMINKLPEIIRAALNEPDAANASDSSE